MANSPFGYQGDGEDDRDHDHEGSTSFGGHRLGFRFDKLEKDRIRDRKERGVQMVGKFASVLTSREVRTSLVKDSGVPAPAWSTSNTIGFDEDKLGDLGTTEGLLSFKGLSVHEVAHILFSPRSGSDIAQWVRDEDVNEAFQVLEEQRIETLLVGRFGASVVPWLTSAIANYLLDNPDGLPSAYTLIRGRRYLPVEVRTLVRRSYENQGDLAELSRIVDAYRLLLFPADTERAKELIQEFKQVLDRLTKEPKNSCGDKDADTFESSGDSRPLAPRDQREAQKNAKNRKNEQDDEPKSHEPPKQKGNDGTPSDKDKSDKGDKSDSKESGADKSKSKDSDESDKGESSDKGDDKSDESEPGDDEQDTESGDEQGDESEQDGDEQGDESGSGGDSSEDQNGDQGLGDGDSDAEGDSDSDVDGDADGDGGDADSGQGGEGDADAEGGDGDSDEQGGSGVGDTASDQQGGPEEFPTPDAQDVADALQQAVDAAKSQLKDSLDRDMRELNGELELMSNDAAEPRKTDWSLATPDQMTQRAAKAFGNELERLKADNEPGWDRVTPSGRINPSRYLRGAELDEAFDRWTIGREDATDIEAVIALDVSSSMNSSGRSGNAMKAMWGIKRALDRVNARCTVITYNSGMPEMLYKPEENAGAQMKTVHPSGGTNPVHAIKYATKRLAESDRSIKILFSITDGEWGSVEESDRQIKTLRQAGVLTALAMIDERDLELSKITSHNHEIVAQIKTSADLFVLGRHLVRVATERNLAR